jgi:hypothetical protein
MAMPPVIPVPTAVPVAVVPVTVPVHLLGLETVHLVGSGERGLSRFLRRRLVSVFCERIWRQRGCLRARGKRGGAGGGSKCEFQKVTTFHDISSFVIHECRQFRRSQMNVR